MCCPKVLYTVPNLRSQGGSYNAVIKGSCSDMKEAVVYMQSLTVLKTFIRKA